MGTLSGGRSATQSHGPEVVIEVRGDDHFEPDSTETVNLGIEGFPGWDAVDFATLQRGLNEVSQRVEKLFNYPMYGATCNDPEFLSGLSHYLQQVGNLGGAAPYDPAILRSCTRVALGKSDSERLRSLVADLIDHPHADICKHIFQTCEDALQLALRRGNASFHLRTMVSEELAAKLFEQLPSLEGSNLCTALQICSLRGVEPDQRATIRETALKAGQSDDPRLLDVAVSILVQEPIDLQTEKVLRKRIEADAPPSYESGAAMAKLMELHPNNEELQNRAFDMIGKNPFWYDPSLRYEHRIDRFSFGLLSSHLPEAVLLATQKINMEFGSAYNQFKPIALLKLLAQNWYAKDQVERDINTLRYYLTGVQPPSIVAHQVATIVKHGSKSAISFLQDQLQRPPHQDRPRTILRAFKDANISV